MCSFVCEQICVALITNACCLIALAAIKTSSCQVYTQHTQTTTTTTTSKQQTNNNTQITFTVTCLWLHCHRVWRCWEGEVSVFWRPLHLLHWVGFVVCCVFSLGVCFRLVVVVFKISAGNAVLGYAPVFTGCSGCCKCDKGKHTHTFTRTRIHAHAHTRRHQE